MTTSEVKEEIKRNLIMAITEREEGSMYTDAKIQKAWKKGIDDACHALSSVIVEEGLDCESIIDFPIEKALQSMFMAGICVD